MYTRCVSPDNPGLLSYIPVTVQVLDVNDNAPQVAAADEEVIVCESTRAGQVGGGAGLPVLLLRQSSQGFLFIFLHLHENPLFIVLLIFKS